MTHSTDGYGEDGYGEGGYGGSLVSRENQQRILQTFDHPLVSLSPNTTARALGMGTVAMLDQVDRDILETHDAMFLPTAGGAELDHVAAWVGLTRRDGEDDQYFRRRIRAEGALTRMNPTFEEIAPYIVETLLETEYSKVSFTTDLSNDPATLKIQTDTGVFADAVLTRSDIDEYILDALPAGHSYERNGVLVTERDTIVSDGGTVTTVSDSANLTVNTSMSTDGSAATGYPSTSAPDWWDLVGGFYETPPGVVTESEATHTATTASELLDYVQVADATIWVPNDTTIDLTNVTDHSVADGVTIASGRNIPKDIDGGTLEATDSRVDGDHVFKSYADNVRLSGLQLKGPIPNTYITEYNSNRELSFIRLLGATNLVDNCEIYGWPFAGLVFGAQSYTPSHEVRYCHIHDNLMDGLGYGVEMDNGHHDIHHCYFDRCRHALDGYGYATNGYEVWHSVVGPEPLSHAFDMHRLGQNLSNPDNPDQAGGTILIHDNLFEFTTDIEGRGQEGVAIRGIPDDVCEVDSNEFKHTSHPDDGTVDEQGDAWRQEQTDNQWVNFAWDGLNNFDTSKDYQLPSGV